jgi:hypothetical protein
MRYVYELLSITLKKRVINQSNLFYISETKKDSQILAELTQTKIVEEFSEKFNGI